MLDLQKAFDILLNWKTNNPKYIELFREKFYNWVNYLRKWPKGRKSDMIRPRIVVIDNHQELLDLLIHEFGQKGVEDLVVYLLEHDNRYENTDTIENYKTYKPYPSYFVQFAYLLIFILPKGFRTRRLFEVFWEHQAKIGHGIDELYVRKYFDAFISEGITSREEIQKLIIKEWINWQDEEESHNGISPWLIIAYYGINEWKEVEKQLEEELCRKYKKQMKNDDYLKLVLYD